MSKRKRTKPRRRSRAHRERHEWVGGIRRLPFYVLEPEPFRPEILIWLELPGEFVVAAIPIEPNCAPSLGEALRQAVETPLVGPPRRPTRIRVEHQAGAIEARSVVPDAEIVIALAPELDRVVDAMQEGMVGDDLSPSYLGEGRIPEAAVRSLFEAAERLYRCAPWKQLEDESVIGLDVPDLGVEGGCISVIGALEESVGMIVFSSYTAFERFARVADNDFEAAGHLDLGTTMLSLNFEQGAALPESLRREVATHGWPVASTAAYPMVLCVDRDAVTRPHTVEELRLLTACASALEHFVAEHSALFGVQNGPPMRTSLVLDGLEIQLTYHYEAGIHFERIDGAAAAASRADTGTAISGEMAAEIDPAHALDEQLSERMIAFAASEFGEEWFDACASAFIDFESTLDLSIPWALYHQKVDGKPLARWFVAAERARLSPEERRWLEVQQEAWVSVWEVSDVSPGRSLVLEDLLTGERRVVQEVGASLSLTTRDVILARIVAHDGRTLLAGCHPRPLPPRAGAEVVRRARGRLRRRGKVAIGRLRDHRIGRYLVRCWEETVDEYDEQSSTLPTLHNTDGDPLLLTVDHFEFETGDREAIEQGLARLEGVVPPPTGDSEPAWVLLRSADGGDTVVGRLVIGACKLRAETNSIARADVVREQLEMQMEGKLRHRTREHSDPLALHELGDGGTGAESEPLDVPPAELVSLACKFKSQHYSRWPDEPVPALEGKTPRDAVLTRAGRRSVDLLLKEMENGEARLPAAERFDFSVLRRKLGFEG